MSDNINEEIMNNLPDEENATERSESLMILRTSKTKSTLLLTRKATKPVLSSPVPGSLTERHTTL